MGSFPARDVFGVSCIDRLDLGVTARRHIGLPLSASIIAGRSFKNLRSAARRIPTSGSFLLGFAAEPNQGEELLTRSSGPRYSTETLLVEEPARANKMPEGVCESGGFIEPIRLRSTE